MHSPSFLSFCACGVLCALTALGGCAPAGSDTVDAPLQLWSDVDIWVTTRAVDGDPDVVEVRVEVDDRYPSDMPDDVRVNEAGRWACPTFEASVEVTANAMPLTTTPASLDGPRFDPVYPAGGCWGPRADGVLARTDAPLEVVFDDGETTMRVVVPHVLLPQRVEVPQRTTAPGDTLEVVFPDAFGLTLTAQEPRTLPAEQNGENAFTVDLDPQLDERRLWLGIPDDAPLGVASVALGGWLHASQEASVCDFNSCEVSRMFDDASNLIEFVVEAPTSD